MAKASLDVPPRVPRSTVVYWAVLSARSGDVDRWGPVCSSGLQASSTSPALTAKGKCRINTLPSEVYRYASSHLLICVLCDRDMGDAAACKRAVWHMCGLRQADVK